MANKTSTVPINDLTDTFLGYYDTKHDQQDIKNYGIYF